MVISWPRNIKPGKLPRQQFHHVNDIAPTIYEILGIKPPRVVDGYEQEPLDGVSMVYTFDDPKASGRKHTQYFEILGSRGIYHDGWFACTIGPRLPWTTDMSALRNWDPNEDAWELYNLKQDYSQSRNIAEENPQKLEELNALFLKQAADNKVLPIGASFYTSFFNPAEMPSSPLTEWTFFEGQTRIPEAVAPKFLSGRSSLAVIDAEIDKKTEGVLFAVGGISAGFTVYMDEGVLKAEYNAMTINRYKVSSDSPIETGKVKIEVETVYDRAERMAPATLTLRVNGKKVGEGRIERSVPGLFTGSETFDVGMDLGSPVALDYHKRAPFNFNGKIENIHIRYLE